MCWHYAEDHELVHKNVDTDVLRTFITIVEQSWFNDAAIALGRLQSAVRMQVKRPEASLANLCSFIRFPNL